MTGHSRLFRTSAAIASSPVRPPGGLIAARDYPRNQHLRNPELVLGAQGKVYTPDGLFIQSGDPLSRNFEFTVDSDIEEEAVNNESTDYASQHWRKKDRQSQKWATEVIPMLIEPYVALLRESNSLRNLDNFRNPAHCEGCTNGSNLVVSCIYFNSMLTVVVYNPV